MITCPGCGKSVSEYLGHCPNCGADLTKEHLSGGTESSNISLEGIIPVKKLNAKIITLVIAVMTILCLIIYIIQPLHGNDKIAYDLISKHKNTFVSDVKVLSGTAGGNGNKKYAYLAISYKNSFGNSTKDITI